MKETWLWPKQVHSYQPLWINRARVFYCRPSVLHPCLSLAIHAEGENFGSLVQSQGRVRKRQSQYMFSFLFFNRRTIDNRLFLSFPTQQHHYQHLDPAAPLPAQLFVLFFAIIFQSRQGSSEKAMSITKEDSPAYTKEKDHAEFTSDQAQIARLRRKIDWRLIPLLSLMYLFSFLDRVNIGKTRRRQRPAQGYINCEDSFSFWG